MEYNVFQNNNLLDRLKDNKDWKLYNLLDIFQDDTKNALKIKKEEYLSEGENPIVDQGQSYIGGYTNRNDRLYKNIPSIIFGDHTRIIKYVDFPMFIGADGVKLLKSKINNKELNVKYVYYFLKSIELPSDGYSRHFKYLKQLVIPVPIIIIQNKIVDVLDKAKELIDKRKEQIEALDELVKSRFIEMFGEPIRNPKGWNKDTIGSVIKSLTAGWSANGEAREKREGEKAVLKVSAVTQGFFKADEYKVIDEDTEIKKYVFPEKGDLLFSRANTREMVGATCIIHKDHPDLLLPDKLWKILFGNRVNVFYMKYILSDPSIRAEFSAKSTGTSGSMYNVSMDKFKNIEIPVPPINLQNQFADFVNQVDKLKFEMESSLKEVENNFNSLMQKAFKGQLFS